MIQDELHDLIKYIPDDLKDDAKNLQEELDNKSSKEEVISSPKTKNIFRRFFRNLSDTDKLKKWFENMKSVGDNAPKVYSQAKEALNKIYDFCKEVNMHEAMDYIEKIKNSFESYI